MKATLDATLDATMDAKSLLHALNTRYAVKQFSDQTIEEDQLKQLLTATQLSASSFGLQPYQIFVIRSESLRESLVPHSMGQDKVVNSSHLIVFASRTLMTDTEVDLFLESVSKTQDKSLDCLQAYGKQIKGALAAKSSQELESWAKQQTYLALGNFLTSAALLGIDACPMEGFDAKGYDEILKLNTKDLTTAVICPIGIRHKDDKYSELPKVRKPYDELIKELA